jgi:hypothetical protein
MAKRSRLNKALGAFALFCISGVCGGVNAGEDRNAAGVLDNGQVRLVFDRVQGTFEAYSLSSQAIRILSAAPVLEVNGRKVSVADLEKIEATTSQFEDKLGRGQRLTLKYQFKGDLPNLRYELRLYRDHPWIGATAYLPTGDYKLGDVSLIEGRIRLPNPFKARIYVNSGDAGDYTGVWQFGMRRWRSDTLSAWYLPELKDCLSFGFYSFHRASTSVVSQYESSSEVRVDAIAHYNGYKPQGEELQTESLLVSFEPDPLRALEQWTDAAVAVVQPKFLDDTRTGLDNTWYAIGDKASEEFGLQQAKILRKTPLYRYGVTFVELGEWQRQRGAPGDAGDELGFGEDEVDSTLYPHGIPWLCEQYHQLGFGCSFGANYAYAGLSTSTAKKDPPWLVKSDLGRLGFGYPIDYTDPDAQKWVYNVYHTAVNINAKWVWSDFDGGPKRGDLHDPTKIRGFEDIREGIKAIRKAVGPDAFIHRFCCGPYFTYVGLVDRVRTGEDVFGLGDWEGLKDIARALAGTYMLHRRFWINDPDPLLVGARDFVHNYGADPIAPDPAILDEVHMRMQLQVWSGSFLTLGENLEDFTPQSIHLLTQVLPSYGQAARPLDLFLHTTPEMYDLSVKTDWDQWHVLMLHNWNDSDKEYDVRFADLGLDDRKTYLVFRFWDQKFLGEHRGNTQLRVGRRKGETYSIREMPEHPWVLSTDMHLTQGGVELKNVKYDSGTDRLTGTALRQPGADGQVVLYVPPGYHIVANAISHSEEKQASGATIVKLRLQFVQEAAQWSLDFEKNRGVSKPHDHGGTDSPHIRSS